jgi:hypothetical protein
MGTYQTQPGHVFVAVSESSHFPSEQVFYVDVFNQGSILAYGRSEQTGAGIGTLPPASVSSMMCRVAGNVINAINRRPTSGLELPWFAALSTLAALEEDNYLLGRVCDFIRATPFLNETDLDVVEEACEDTEMDGWQAHAEFCRQMRNYDEVGRPPKRKSSEYAMVRFDIGQVFKHRLYRFVVYVTMPDDLVTLESSLDTTAIAIKVKCGKRTWYDLISRVLNLKSKSRRFLGVNISPSIMYLRMMAHLVMVSTFGCSITHTSWGR